MRLMVDGRQALTTLEQMIDGATSSIDVLMFQWENDTVGAEIAEHIVVKAGPKFRVRVLVDGGGNLIFGQSDPRRTRDVNGLLQQLAQKPYVEILRTRDPFG